MMEDRHHLVKIEMNKLKHELFNLSKEGYYNEVKGKVFAEHPSLKKELERC